MRARRVGRPYKHKLGAIVTHRDTGQMYVAVDRRSRGTKSEYRVIPLTGRHQRYGPATWVNTSLLEKAGKHSHTASVLTYRANEYLDAEVGRECDCHCCVHTRIPHQEFKRASGEWKDGE